MSIEKNKQFVVDLVSYSESYVCVGSDLNREDAYYTTLNIIKETEADCVVFGGGLLYGNRQLNKLIKDIVKMCLNREVVVVVEVMHDNNYAKGWSGSTNCIHVLYCKNGLVYDRGSMIPQLFAKSDDLTNRVDRKELMQKMYLKMMSNMFVVKGKRCCVIQCGEINFLEGRDVKNVRVRGCKSVTYVDDINALVDNTDIFFDVIHTPMGEQGVVQAKWAWLSKDERVCMTVCNSGNLVSSLEKLSSLQYCFNNGKNKTDKLGKIVDSNDDYIVRRFKM